mmetsp:Transcript_53081/g.113474  ORF Transcript_53081/g.113474 Transcript_53081/m.113474 type:complete len:129 (-) Transcript_53081:156-542(-)
MPVQAEQLSLDELHTHVHMARAAARRASGMPSRASAVCCEATHGTETVGPGDAVSHGDSRGNGKGAWGREKRKRARHAHDATRRLISIHLRPSPPISTHLRPSPPLSAPRRRGKGASCTPRGRAAARA